MKVFVTHSFKEEFDTDGKPIGDPGMTPKGCIAIKGLNDFISCLFNGKPDHVVSATGRRHTDIPDTLGLEVNRYTVALGGPDSLVTINGEKKITLASGRVVPYGEDVYSSGVTPEGVENEIRRAPDNTLFCVGRPTILFGFGLTKDQAKSGAVYEIKEEGGEISLVLIKDGVNLNDDGERV
ncbi:MAG: hypothetical protein PHZ04_01890 [Patescibacteria group bacterium]|nr:hypothetical protein [Patescibacteria group bacterium]MDD5295044.1 hypothetical protein [Patescibacteria group bacterium]MDD5554816.1 hypothetical protein [Patescibacteria group bacterium]